MRTKLIRSPENGGACAICGSEVELIIDPIENWKIKCDCKEVDVPVWCTHDAYARRIYRRKFELVIVPDVEGVKNGS